MKKIKEIEIFRPGDHIEYKFDHPDKTQGEWISGIVYNVNDSECKSHTVRWFTLENTLHSFDMEDLDNLSRVRHKIEIWKKDQ